MCIVYFWNWGEFDKKLELMYRTHAIITRSLYTFTPYLKAENVFLRTFFRKILTLCTASIPDQFIIKSGLWWRVYGMYIVAIE